MLAPDVLRTVDAYWANHFGCSPEELQSVAPVLLPHAAALADYVGAYILQRDGAAPVLSLPPAWLAHFGPRLAAAAQEGLAADGRWIEILGPLLERAVGPAWIGYASVETLQTTTGHVDVRLLGSGDTSLVESLRCACTITDWENVASLPRAKVTIGAFADGELAAIAGYQVWGESLAHIAVLTHPAHRGRGLARAVVSVVATRALEQGLIPQYRVLATNASSRAVADALGFERYATSLALRFSPSPEA